MNNFFLLKTTKKEFPHEGTNKGIYVYVYIYIYIYIYVNFSFQYNHGVLIICNSDNVLITLHIQVSSLGSAYNYYSYNYKA